MNKIITSISTFKNIVESGYIYVDKTKYIYEMVKQPFGQFFFSRPRRFGKSLTVSTLEAFFSGEKELFKNYYIYDKDCTWDKYPIIHIDFGRIDSSTALILEDGLKLELQSIAEKYKVRIKGTSPATIFGELIKSLNNKFNKGVVILVDEYDRPITNNLEDGKGVKQISRIMEAFYQMIKGYESLERFVFITGITRLSQVSLFSKLNNLVDISRSEQFSDAVGYNKEELEKNFTDYINEAIKVHNCEKSELMSLLADWYDGFKFSYNGMKVYNPVSIGNFFNNNYRFSNYWYATATPVLLINFAKKQKLTLEIIDNALISDISYNSFDIMSLSESTVDSQTIVQLLFQTGYLTIGEKEEKSNIPLYKLVYPNKEVQMSFETDLAPIFLGKTKSDISTITTNLQKYAYDFDVDGMIRVIKGALASIPYGIQINNEKYYQSLIVLMFRMCGMDISAESMTNIGRIDAVLKVGDYIYVIECKIDKSAEEALNQIRDKKYTEKYDNELQSGRTIVALGINFSSTLRNIDDYRVEMKAGLA